MKSYKEIFLMTSLMSFFTALCADELSERIGQLHQSLTQLKTKLEVLKNGLETISGRLRGEKQPHEEVCQEFAGKINGLRSVLAQDISENDAQASQDANDFWQKFLAPEQEARFNNVDISTVLDLSVYVQNASNHLVTKLYTKYGKVSEPDSFMQDYSSFKTLIERDDRHKDYKPANYTGYNKVKAMTWALIGVVKDGLKPDAEVLTDILPQFEKKDRDLAVAFILLANHYSERDFLEKTVAIIIKDSSKNELQELLNGVTHYILSQVIFNGAISKEVLQKIHSVCKNYNPADNPQKQTRAELLAALYARYFLDEIKEFKQKTIHLENQRKQEERKKEAEKRERKEEKKRLRREKAKQKQRDEEEQRKQKLEESLKVAAQEERIKLEAEKQKIEEDRQQREEEEQKKELQRQQEEKDRVFNESLEALKQDWEEPQVSKKEKPEDISSLLKQVIDVAAININLDIIDRAKFNFTKYLGDLLEHVTAQALQSNYNLKKVLGYTEAIIRNILSSEATLQGMVIRLQEDKEDNEIKPIAKIIALLRLLPNEFIITPNNEQRLTDADIKPLPGVLYAADPNNKDVTNILRYYIRFVAKIDSLAIVRDFVNQNSVSMGPKKTLLDKLKQELDKK